MTVKEACVFDVDGVLIHSEERFWRAKELASALNKNYRDLLYKEELMRYDRPRQIGIKLLKERSGKCSIIVITGRPKESYELTLKEILNATGIRPDLILMRTGNEDNLLRAKLAMIKELFRRGYEIKEIHDDDISFLREIRKTYPEVKLYYHIHDRFVILK